MDETISLVKIEPTDLVYTSTTDPFAFEEAFKLEYPQENEIINEIEVKDFKSSGNFEELDDEEPSLKINCLDCGAEMLSSELVKHRIEFHLSKFICDVCQKSYRNKNLLLRHILRHFPEDTIPCDHCSKKFTNRKDFIVHKNRFHSDQIQFTCNLCEETHDDKKSMLKCRESHLVKKKRVNEKSCPICDKKMKTNSIYSHIRMVHNKEREKMCQICGKALRTTYDLKVHLRRHSGERPEICETCGKTFVSYSQLYKHRKVRHMERDNFDCSICQKRLLSKFKLKQHELRFHPDGFDNGIRVNLETNCYHCSICSLKFVAMHKYEKHVKLNDCHKYQESPSLRAKENDDVNEPQENVKEFRCQECGR